MSVHSFVVELRSPGTAAFPGVEDGGVLEIERVARQAVVDSGLLPAGCEVVMPQPVPPPASPPGV